MSPQLRHCLFPNKRLLGLTPQTVTKSGLVGGFCKTVAMLQSDVLKPLIAPLTGLTTAMLSNDNRMNVAKLRLIKIRS